MNQPFIIVKNYHYEGDFQFGVWNEARALYEFADGDAYTLYYVRFYMSDVEFLTQYQLEEILKNNYADKTTKSAV